MRESQRYRYKAADCLRPAQQAHDHSHRAVYLSRAVSWQITNSANVRCRPSSRPIARQTMEIPTMMAIWPGNRNHSSQPISIPARSRYTSPIKSLVYRCGGGNNARLALRRSNFDCRT
jgi:hypothetical protein